MASAEASTSNAAAITATPKAARAAAPPPVAPVKRLEYTYSADDQHAQDKIYCEILVKERGSWVALPIYNSSVAPCNVCGDRTIATGYIESTADTRFRILLGYNKGSSRTGHWLIKDDLLCSLYVDGRKKPVSEHTIRKGTFENPVDLTAKSCEESETAALYSTIPSEEDQPFSWRTRDDAYEDVEPCRYNPASLDDYASLRLTLSKCSIRRVIRGTSYFPSSDPETSYGRRDKAFEAHRYKNPDIPHEVHIQKVDHTPGEKMDTISDFVATSDPFVEFRLYYKDGAALQARGVKPAKERLGRGAGRRFARSGGPATIARPSSVPTNAMRSKGKMPAVRRIPKSMPPKLTAKAHTSMLARMQSPPLLRRTPSQQQRPRLLKGKIVTRNATPSRSARASMTSEQRAGQKRKLSDSDDSPPPVIVSSVPPERHVSQTSSSAASRQSAVTVVSASPASYSPTKPSKRTRKAPGKEEETATEPGLEGFESSSSAVWNPPKRVRSDAADPTAFHQRAGTSYAAADESPTKARMLKKAAPRNSESFLPPQRKQPGSLPSSTSTSSSTVTSTPSTSKTLTTPGQPHHQFSSAPAEPPLSSISNSSAPSPLRSSPSMMRTPKPPTSGLRGPAPAAPSALAHQQNISPSPITAVAKRTFGGVGRAALTPRKVPPPRSSPEHTSAIFKTSSSPPKVVPQMPAPSITRIPEQPNPPVLLQDLAAAETAAPTLTASSAMHADRPIPKPPSSEPELPRTADQQPPAAEGTFMNYQDIKPQIDSGIQVGDESNFDQAMPPADDASDSLTPVSESGPSQNDTNLESSATDTAQVSKTSVASTLPAADAPPEGQTQTQLPAASVKEEGIQVDLPHEGQDATIQQRATVQIGPVTVQREVIDLTMDSEEEGEQADVVAASDPTQAKVEVDNMAETGVTQAEQTLLAHTATAATERRQAEEGDVKPTIVQEHTRTEPFDPAWQLQGASTPPKPSVVPEAVAATTAGIGGTSTATYHHHPPPLTAADAGTPPKPAPQPAAGYPTTPQGATSAASFVTPNGGVERNARARAAATTFLDSLGILDDANVEDLLVAGFKSAESFAPRLNRLEATERDSILAELRDNMGKIDYGILASNLRIQGVPC